MIENVKTAVLKLVPKSLSFLMTKYFVRTVVLKNMELSMEDDRLSNVHEQYKTLRRLQYYYEWEDKPEAARIYQLQALEKKKLLNEGIFFEPNF